MDSHLPPGNPRHLNALVGPSMAFVFLVSLISFLVHHWCPDAKGKSQEEEASASGQSGEGRRQCTGLCSRQDPDTELSFFPPSLPSLFGCIESSLQHWGTWLHHVESFILVLGLSSLVHRLNCPQGMWDLSSWTRDGTCIPCLERRILNHWPPGNSQDRAFKREHQWPCPSSQLTGCCLLLHWSSAVSNI